MRKWLKLAKKRWYIGWVVAVALLLLYGLSPRIVTKTKIKTVTRVRTETKWNTDLKAAPDAKATLNPDGSIDITGGFVLKGSGEKKGSTDTDHSSATTQKPARAWSMQVSVAAMVPRSAFVLGADYHIGKILIFDVGAGARVELPFGNWTPNRVGAGLVFSF